MFTPAYGLSHWVFTPAYGQSYCVFSFISTCYIIFPQFTLFVFETRSHFVALAGLSSAQTCPCLPVLRLKGATTISSIRFKANEYHLLKNKETEAQSIFYKPGACISESDPPETLFQAKPVVTNPNSFNVN